MAAGSVLYATGTAKLTELGGVAYRLPWVMFCYMIAAVSISGFPLFNGFISKNMTINGAAEAHHIWLALGMELAAVGTFLSVGLKLPYFAFWYKKDYTKEVKQLPKNMYVAMGIASFLCFIIGVVPSLLYRLLPYPVDYVPYTPWHVLESLLLLSFTGLGFYLARRVLVPKAKINLDFDYFYRVFGNMGLAIAKWPIEKLDNWWTEFYNRMGLAGMLLFAKETRTFDEKAIDGVVDGTAYSVLGTGKGLTKLQTGKLSDYIGLALVIALGLFALFYLL